MASRPLLFDLQGAQSIDHRDRGVARYVTELALALEALVPGRVAAYLLNPDLPLPGGIEPLVATGRLRFVDEPSAYVEGAILHLASPIELSVPLDRLLPPAARDAGCRVVVTLFDLIPEAMPDTYLSDPGLRRRYRVRRELVRQADRVIAISRYTAAEAARLLGVPDRRITVVELAPSPSFRPPADRSASLETARKAVPGLADRYVLYTGGSDGRKNIEGLLEAWARLPGAIRSEWQLVVACHLPPLQRNHYEVRAGELGFAEGFVVTGWVPEETLVSLYQGAGLFVFPSLAEGFGLPVAEALACGTPTVGSDRTSVPELLAPEAVFDPEDPQSIASAIERGLTDGPHRERLAGSARPVRTWHAVALETLAVYDGVAASTTPSRRLRKSEAVAFVSPLPPLRGGVADYSFRLLDELRHLTDVDAYVDGPPHERAAMLDAQGPSGVATRPLAALPSVEAAAGPYEHVVYCLGNSEFHTGALSSLLRRPGTVVAHDVRFTTLYRFAPWQHPDAAPHGFQATLHRMYPGRLPAELGVRGEVTPEEADRWGLLMAREVIGASRRFVATSPFGAALARLDARPEHRDRVTWAPFGVVAGGTRASDDGRNGGPVVASFGVVNELKLGPTIVDAFALAAPAGEARLVFVGPASERESALIRGRAADAGIADRVEVTGAVDEDAYREWLRRATIAVQLRASTNGESSAAVGDCLGAGIPTIVSAIGANRSLPPEVALAVPAVPSAHELSAAMSSLLEHPDRRASLSAGASAYAEAHTFRKAAEALYALLSSER